jgi:hypothetical protein
MAIPSSAGGKLARRRRSVPKAARLRSDAARKRQTVIERMTRERDEALEQLSATSDVLKVINSSPGEPQLVFSAILQNAMRICEANFGNLLLLEGEGLRSAASHNYPTAYSKLHERGPLLPGPHTGLGRILRTKQIVHIVDLATDRAYAAAGGSSLSISLTSMSWNSAS